MSYYILRVQDVGEKGRDIHATAASDEWLKKIIDDALPVEGREVAATLSAKAVRVKRSLEITGGVYLKFNIPCNRCLEEFTFERQVPFRLIMEPEPKGKGGVGDGEDLAEEISESLDFSYYDGDEIDVGDLIRQHIVMAQPMSYVCGEACKGLCPKCGKNLNDGPCRCKADKKESPFAVLKKLKPRRRKKGAA